MNKLANGVKKESESLASTLDVHGEHIVRSIIHLAAFGVSSRTISKNLNLPMARVKMILKSVTVQSEINRIQTELYERDAKKMFMRMLPEAAAITYKMMKSKRTREMTKLSAASMIMDRALGKPTQHVVEEKSELKEVFMKLHEKHNPPAAKEQPETIIIDGKPVEEKEEIKKDPIDEVLDQV